MKKLSELILFLSSHVWTVICSILVVWMFLSFLSEIPLESYRSIFEDCDYTDSIFKAFELPCDNYSDTTRIEANTIINDTGYINYVDYIYLDIFDNFNRLDADASKEEAYLINYKQSLESLYIPMQAD